MKLPLRSAFTVASAAAFVAAHTSQLAPAMAQEADPAALGRQVYEERCSVCHGENGKGDGTVGVLFELPPGDLTNLQPEGLMFPYMDVLAKIDGREVVAGHGSEMPIWGEAFMVESLEDRGINPKDAADIVQARLVSLLFYLATLQDR